MSQAAVGADERASGTPAQDHLLWAAKRLVAADDNQAQTQTIVDALRAAIKDFEASLAAVPEPSSSRDGKMLDELLRQQHWSRQELTTLRGQETKVAMTMEMIRIHEAKLALIDAVLGCR